MSIGTPNVHTHTKIGSCPHGLPAGACPICNGTAGGNSTTKRDTPRNAGEMTYNQCAAIGAMLKAQKHAKQLSDAAEQSRLNALAQFQKNIAITHLKLKQLSVFISNNIPPIIAKPLNFLINTTIGNVLKFIHNIPSFISNITQAISQKISDISDKLAAVYGEMKAAVGEKISKFFAGFKKKFKSLFFISETFETDDDEHKIEEDKRQFEIRTFIHKLCQKLKHQDEKEIEKNAHKSVE